MPCVRCLLVLTYSFSYYWWVVTVSNCRHSACKADALPTELTIQNGGESGIRTPYTVRWKIYSLLKSPMLLTLQFGSPRWVRTTDLRINSPSLYRLSYQGINLVPTIGFELMTYRLQGDCTTTVLSRLIWSEYKDSNFGPSGPKPDALPGCATLRKYWCPVTESNCQLLITKQLLYHLTNRALFGAS